MRYFVLFAASTLLVACANVIKDSPAMKLEGLAAIERCLYEWGRQTGHSLSPDVDRAYVYASQTGFWVNLTHGAAGTFGRRSLDYRLALSCGLLADESKRVVYLGEPLQDPIITEPGRDKFDDEIDITELLFKREGDEFVYCCSQPFDFRNIDKHNPDLPRARARVSD